MKPMKPSGVERGGLKTFVGGILVSRRLPILVAALAVLLTLSSLGVGWIADDYHHRLVMKNPESRFAFVRSQLDMFRFMEGDPERIREMMDTGILPWWTYPGIKGAFWRPLASLTHVVDYVLWPEHPLLMHAQSILWFGLLAAVVAVLLRDRVARFWAVGMLVSVLSICATFPCDRLLFFVGIGAMGLVARFVVLVFGGLQDRPKSRLWRVPASIIGVLFVLVYVVIAPFALPVRAAFPMGPKSLSERLHIHPALDEAVEEQDLIVVNPPLVFYGLYSPLIWETEGQPLPRRMRLLTSSLFEPVRVHRTDAYTLVVRPSYGYMAHLLDGLFRNEQHPMALGEHVELTGMTVEVTALTDDGRAAEAAFRFDVPLEDASLRWLQYEDGDFVPFSPPAVGETLTLTSD